MLATDGELRGLLVDATGTAEHILSIVIDIRGFSNFCLGKDSFDVANYIKNVYTKIIDQYFPNAAYYKPTGDGLLVIFSFPNKDIKEFLSEQIRKCYSLLSDFRNLCDDNPLINFETPDKIGMGLSRGSACKISVGSKTLDYSGKVINLAARLMNLARPSGIVFDSSLGFGLLPSEIQGYFLQDEVYLRGITEGKPIVIYYTKDHTIIPQSAKQPPKEPKWETVTEQWKFGEIFSSTKVNIIIKLKRKPFEPKRIVVAIHFVRGEYMIGFNLRMTAAGLEYHETADQYWIYIKKDTILNNFKDDKLTADEIITFSISYPIE